MKIYPALAFLGMLCLLASACTVSISRSPDGLVTPSLTNALVTPVPTVVSNRVVTSIRADAPTATATFITHASAVTTPTIQQTSTPLGTNSSVTPAPANPPIRPTQTPVPAMVVSNRTATLSLSVQDGQAQVNIQTTRLVAGQVVLWVGGNDLGRWPRFISPDKPFVYTQVIPAGATGLQLLDADGTVLAQLGEVGEAGE